MTSPRLEGLDALRGIAALLVVGLHTNAVFGGNPWFGKGYLAVDFFLMLSGFLMVRVTEPKLAGGAPLFAWLRGRYWRFWPMMALGGLIGLPHLYERCGGTTDFALAAGANFLLLPYPCDRLIFPLNVPAWTILAELIANAAHLLLLRRLRTGAVALLALVALALTALTIARFGSLDVGARPEHLAFTLPRVFFAYMLGMLLGRVSPEQLGAPLPGWIAPLLLPLGILLGWWIGWSNWTFDLAYVVMVCPLAIVAALKLHRTGWLGWFSAAFAFPLFAIHVPIIEGARWLGFGVLYAVLVAFAAALVVVAWQHRERWSHRNVIEE